MLKTMSGVQQEEVRHTHINRPYTGSSSSIENTVEFRSVDRGCEYLPTEGKLPQVMLQI